MNGGQGGGKGPTRKGYEPYRAGRRGDDVERDRNEKKVAVRSEEGSSNVRAGRGYLAGRGGGTDSVSGSPSISRLKDKGARDRISREDVEDLDSEGGNVKPMAQAPSISQISLTDGGVDLKQLQARVEEEVINKLARASMMNVLYRQHISKQEEAQPPPPPPAPSSSRNLAGGKEKEKRTLIDVNNVKLSRPTARATQNIQQRGGRGYRAGGKESDTNGESSQSSSAPPSSTERLEVRFQSALKKVVFSEGSASNDQLLELWGHISKARSQLSRIYTSALLQEEGTGISPGSNSAGSGVSIMSRLWLLYYREIEHLQQKLKAGGEAGIFRKRWKEVICEGHEFFGGLLSKLRGGGNGDEGGLCYIIFGLQKTKEEVDVLQVALIAKGDLARYEGTYGDGGPEQKKGKWAEAAGFYESAMAVGPENGKVYNQLAILAMYKEEIYQAAYLYYRSLTAVTPFIARENLLSLFERCKRKSSSFPRVDNLMTLKFAEHKDRFSINFLLAASTVMSKIDVDKFEHYRTTSSRHLSMMMTKAFRGGEGGADTVKHILWMAVIMALANFHLVYEKEGHLQQVPVTVKNGIRLVLSMLSDLLGEEAIRSATEADWNDVRGGGGLILLEWMVQHQDLVNIEGSDSLRGEVLKKLERLKHSGLPFVSQRFPACVLEEDLLCRGIAFMGTGVEDRIKEWGGERGFEEGLRRKNFQVVRFRAALRALEESGLIGEKEVKKQVEEVTIGMNGLTVERSEAGVSGLENVGSIYVGNDIVMDRVCPGCSNILEGDITACEFCGEVVVERTEEEKKAAGGGMLKGIDFGLVVTAKDAAKQQEIRRAKEARYGGGGRVEVRKPLAEEGHGRLVVVDAPNVAMRHGLNNEFSSKGIALAIEYYKAAGFKVVSFLPDYYLNADRVGEMKRMQKLKIGDVRNAQLPNDVGMLNALVQARLLIGTPPQDYDDSYTIKYAKLNNGYLVTNDMYRDHVKKITDKKEREDTKKWLKDHCISYTFIQDEFLPNPDFHFGPTDGHIS